LADRVHWLICLGRRQKAMKIECARVHPQLSIGSYGPLFPGTIPVELDSITVRISQIQCLADAMVGGSVQLDATVQKRTQGSAQIGARGVQDCEVVEAGSPGRRLPSPS